MSKAFDELQKIIQSQREYGQIIGLLYWDMETIMPKKAFDLHSDSLTRFSTENFKLSTSDELKNCLEELIKPEEFDALDEDWKFIVKRMKRQLDENQRIPVDLYSEFVRAQAESGQAWREAKKASDFSIFAPHLQKMIDLTTKMTTSVHPDKELYDAMLDSYEEGMDSATIDRIFEELKAGLIPLVKDILSKPEPDDSKFRVEYDLNEEREAQKLLLSYIGFDWDKGCVGETEHPFTVNFSSSDVRVTNHFHTDQAIDPMFSAIHEGGHAIFEQNVNPKLDGTAGGSCAYMGIHESQSRFYENILGRNRNFWVPIYDKIQATVSGLKGVSLDEFYREINHIRNSYIRTEADEVTYCLHIIIRYEIEKAIFRDHLPVGKLPELWNSKMQEYLGITPRNDAEGILQDMHWSDGSFGYFPTYLLGTIYDGMYLDKLNEVFGSVDNVLAEGRILEITHWLNENIHTYGTTRLPKEVLENVCGKEVSAEPILRYFKAKYTDLYKL